MAGDWIGTYSCTGNCPEGPLGIHLVITQDPDNPALATYTDFDADYSGTICGNRFTFKGGNNRYSESGTFVMDPGGVTATKTSTYKEYFPGICYGTCTDNLTRLDGG
jgi:hypothetical protein